MPLPLWRKGFAASFENGFQTWAESLLTKMGSSKDATITDSQKPDLATIKPKEHTKQKGLTKQQRSCLCRRNRVSNHKMMKWLHQRIRLNTCLIHSTNWKRDLAKQPRNARIRNNGYVGKGISAMIALSSAPVGTRTNWLHIIIINYLYPCSCFLVTRIHYAFALPYFVYTFASVGW